MEYKQLRCYFADYLWNMSVLESAAVGIVTRAVNSPYFSDEEKDFAKDIVLPDEQRHVRIMRRMAESVGQPIQLISVEPYDNLNDIQLLYALHVVERDFSRRFDSVAKAFIHCNNNSDMYVDLLQIEADEQKHIEWGRKILTRLKKEGITWDKVNHLMARQLSEKLKTILSNL